MILIHTPRRSPRDYFDLVNGTGIYIHPKPGSREWILCTNAIHSILSFIHPASSYLYSVGIFAHTDLQELLPLGHSLHLPLRAPLRQF